MQSSVGEITKLAMFVGVKAGCELISQLFLFQLFHHDCLRGGKRAQASIFV